MNKKLIVKSQTRQSLVFLLPSMVECEVGRLSGQAIEWLSEVGNPNSDSVEKIMTSGVVKRIGTEKNISPDFVGKLAPNDINAILLVLRLHTYRRKNTLELSALWKNHEKGTDVAHTHKIDISIDSFDVTYVGDEEVKSYDHLPKYSEVDKDFLEYVEYEDALFVERKTRDRAMLVTKAITSADGTISANYYSGTKYFVFRMRNGEKQYLEPEEFSRMDAELTEELREIDYKMHGEIDTDVTLTCPWDKTQKIQVDLTKQPAFFFPSLKSSPKSLFVDGQG